MINTENVSIFFNEHQNYMQSCYSKKLELCTLKYLLNVFILTCKKNYFVEIEIDTAIIKHVNTLLWFCL